MVVFLAAVLLVNGSCTSGRQNATIEESQETILTYAFGEPDPAPILTRSGLWGRGARLYPYTFIDEFAQEGENRSWRVVRMDNPYISVAILPEVGGKVWGAVEKSTGLEFIYTNKVLKFREIALRGPWTSGGIEFNFGIVGHTPSGAHPVDYLLRTNQDGSVSCFVGNLDLPSRTRWCVEILLPPDKAVFETRASWFNPSPFHQSYYVWMNGAVRVADDLQLLFPGTSSIGHNYAESQRSWPIDGQRDLSWYRNNNFGSYKSYFTVGQYKNWFGGYWHEADFGFGHWARYDDVPGHKFWLWGLSRQGMIWEDLLTDTDGQYSEPQAGRLLNQNDHGLFFPYAGDRWSELWFPYREIGPMVEASPHAVLSLNSDSQTLNIGICALQKLEEDLVIATTQGKELYREPIRMTALETLKRELEAEPGGEFLELRIGDKLYYTDDPEAYALRRPIKFRNYQNNTFQERFLAAERLFRERNSIQALTAYHSLLEEEPQHLQVLNRMAELYCRRGEYGTALDLASKALEVEMYDPEANYSYAVIARRLGRHVDAKETLGWAARSLQYRSASYCQLGEIFLLEGDPASAAAYFLKALDFNAHNQNALLSLAIAKRLAGEDAEAAEILDNIEAGDPLNHAVRFERYRLTPTPDRFEKFQAAVRNEYSLETYLELALHYLGLGLEVEALELFQLTGPYPTAQYWIAYLLRDGSPDRSRNHLMQAEQASARLVFPFREETIPVLEWAVKRQPESWKAKYYLSLLLWSKGRVGEAEQLLESCGSPDFAPLYQARAYFRREKNPLLARADLEKAVEIEEDGWRNWSRLLDFYLEERLDDLALATAQEAAARFPESGSLAVGRVRALINLGRYSAAAEVLDGLRVLPSEGATGVHAIFVDTHIQLGLESIEKRDFAGAIQHLEKSREYPERLGTGRPYVPDQRLQQYLMALCRIEMGELDAAEVLFEAVSSETGTHWGDGGPHAYFGALALLKAGDEFGAKQLLKTAARPDPRVREALKRFRR
jgi:Tfp pilus assembly protein PilF